MRRLLGEGLGVLIAKFNKLIRNKIVWGVFALIVCLAFVFEGLFGRNGNERSSNVAGVLFEEEISSRDFFLARFYELGLQERAGLSPEANARLRERTWRRMAALKTAEKMGLTVSPDEIAEAIRRDPTFQADGVFSQARYKAIVEAQLRVGMQTFEDYLHQDLLIRKLAQVMQSLVWTPPSELSRRLENITDRFKLEYAALPAEKMAGEVHVGAEEARAYYVEHTEQFLEPAKIGVRYVAFPITNYLADAAVSEDEMREYYRENPNDYLSSSTNAPAEPLPFDEVRERIADLLGRRKAMFRARDDASDFVMALAPGRYTSGLSMEDAAAGRGLTVATTAFFSAQDRIPGLDADARATRTAFQLEAGSADAYFSDPIVGSNHVYVIAANERVDERIPDFEEVADRALAAAEAAARKAAVFETCARIRDEAARGGQTLAAALEEYGVDVLVTEPFTVYEGNDEIEFSDAVLPGIMTLQTGEFSDCIATPAGPVLARVVERVPGDFATAQLLRPQMLSTIGRYRAGLLYEDWGNYLLGQAGFQDLLPSYGDDEDNEDDEG